MEKQATQQELALGARFAINNGDNGNIYFLVTEAEENVVTLTHEFLHSYTKAFTRRAFEKAIAENELIPTCQKSRAYTGQTNERPSYPYKGKKQA